MSRAKLLALKDHLVAEIKVVNRSLGIKASSKGAGSLAAKAARKPELWAKRVALIKQLDDVNHQLSEINQRRTRAASAHEFDPILARPRPQRPALSIEPTQAPTFARPEGPRVPQRLYTQTVRKFLKPDCYPKF